MWLALRRRGGRRVWPEPPPGDSVLIFALGVLVAALGWALSWYLTPPAILLFILAALRERKARSKRRSA